MSALHVYVIYIYPVIKVIVSHADSALECTA